MAESARKDNDSFEAPEVFVGKDVLELLSSSMYVNPLSIFREYVQNATDAIDDAVANGLLVSIDGGLIEIYLDRIDRRVIIRDNGTGLCNKDFAKRMLSFGASEKRGTDARGFRGVGRLSALGYVQQLVFRSRAKGDAQVLEATWDGRVVKRLLASNDSDSDLRSIVREAVTLKWLEPENYPVHFFEVELVKPRRIANDRLLNEIEIESFVSQVCPCPFYPEFSFGDEIAALLAPHGRAGKAYRIHINGSEKPVYRPYRDHVEYSDTKRASLRSLKTFEIESINGEPAAVGWLIHHDYPGAIPAAQGVRGLRARIGNIQVGHDRLFLEVFPEDRFCSWTIGEVHVLDARVVPNGRRDEFESNAHLDNIVAHLRPLGAEVARECRISSKKRNYAKAFDRMAGKIQEGLDTLQQGAVSERCTNRIETEIEDMLSEMQKIAGSIASENTDTCMFKDRIASLENAFLARTPTATTMVLACLPAQKRAIYVDVFDLIHEYSVDQGVAKKLIDRILERIERRESKKGR